MAVTELSTTTVPFSNSHSFQQTWTYKTSANPLGTRRPFPRARAAYLEHLLPDVLDCRLPVPLLAPDLEAVDQQDDELSIPHANGHHLAVGAVGGTARRVPQAHLVHQLLRGHTQQAHTSPAHSFQTQSIRFASFKKKKKSLFPSKHKPENVTPRLTSHQAYVAKQASK